VVWKKRSFGIKRRNCWIITWYSVEENKFDEYIWGPFNKSNLIKSSLIFLKSSSTYRFHWSLS
jgi:hypothetical protein